jgi:hypothetical protein
MSNGSPAKIETHIKQQIENLDRRRMFCIRIIGTQPSTEARLVHVGEKTCLRRGGRFCPLDGGHGRLDRDIGGTLLDI